VVSYARISADTVRDENGVDDQHKVNRETAARLGWVVVHEITDNDRSASKPWPRTPCPGSVHRS
jgi:hypothetical protein